MATKREKAPPADTHQHPHAGIRVETKPAHNVAEAEINDHGTCVETERFDAERGEQGQNHQAHYHARGNS